MAIPFFFITSYPLNALDDTVICRYFKGGVLANSDNDKIHYTITEGIL
jgi:hypothetical protein